MIYLRNLIFSICVLSFLSAHIQAQRSNTFYSSNPQLELFRTQKLDWIQKFCEGLALASKDGKMIIINSDGEKQFDYPYDYSSVKFDNDRCVVTKDNLLGLVDKKGRVIVEPMFDVIRSFSKSMIVGKKDQMDGFYDIETKTFNPISDSSINTRDHRHFIYSKNDKSGVVNAENEILIPFEYQKISTKKGEYFVVKKENLFGVVNIKNEIIIPITYDFLYMISLDQKPYFVIKDKNKFGLLDKNGETKIEPDNLVIEYTRAGFLFVKKEDSYIIHDKDINTLFKDSYETVRPLGYGKYLIKNGKEASIFNSNNGEITTPEYTPHGKFQDKTILYKDNELYGLLDTNLNVLIKPSYRDLGLLNMNLMKVKIENSINLLNSNNELLLNDQYEDLGRWIHAGIIPAKRNGRWGLINIVGDSLTAFKYDKITYLRNSKYFQVEIDKSYGIIDIEGTMIKECTLDKIVDQGQYITLKENSKYGLMAKNGKSILPIQYDNITNLGYQYGSSYPNLFRVKKENKTGILNTRSDKSIDFKYDRLEELRIKSIVARIDKKFGLIDPFENEITPFEYGYLEDNANTPLIYASSQENKVGLINRKGEVVIPFEYQTIKHYDNELIAVKKNDLWGFVDKSGELVIQNKFKSVSTFKNNFCVIKDDKLQGLINNKGTIIIPPKYNMIYQLSDDCFGVTIDKKQGLFDSTGVNLLPPIYDRISRFSFGNSVVKKDNKYGVFDHKGKEVVPINLDMIKRRVEQKKVKRFSGYSVTSSPSELYAVTFEQYEFTMDNDGKCVENCPPEEILQRIFSK